MTGEGTEAVTVKSRSEQPTVSIVMVSYNQKQFVGQALESAIAQDYPNLEIIIADDASTDGTADVVADYAARHSQLIKPIFNRENVGVTRNCNIALEQCTGNYIAFLGGDDIFLPGKIARQVEWFERRDQRVLCGHQVDVFYDDRSRRQHRFQHILRQGTGASKAIRYGTYAACSIMIRADRIPVHGFDSQLPLVSDYLLWAEILAAGGEFGYIPGVYARYRRHNSNISNNIPRNVAELVRALDIIEQRYPRYSKECRRARARFQYYPMGVHYLDEGQKWEARKSFLKAIRIEPTFPRPWIGLAKSMV